MHAVSPERLCISNIDSADAVSRRVLYYYYYVEPIAWGRQRIEWELWLKGARHAGSPETMLCNPAPCSVPEHVQKCLADADKPKTAFDFHIGSACEHIRVESTKNVFLRV